jgi:hypothetical protein
LIGLKESSDQFTLAADEHPLKSLEPLSLRNFRLGGQSVSQQPQLLSRNVAALDAVQQARQQRAREILSPNARHR